MSGAETALAAFTIFNAVRVVAYVPQIAKIAADSNGASAVSITTWLLFALSHASTVAYAVFSVGDMALAAIFGVNTAFCALIVGLTVSRRRQFRLRQLAR